MRCPVRPRPLPPVTCAPSVHRPRHQAAPGVFQARGRAEPHRVSAGAGLVRVAGGADRSAGPQASGESRRKTLHRRWGMAPGTRGARRDALWASRMGVHEPGPLSLSPV